MEVNNFTQALLCCSKSTALQLVLPSDSMRVKKSYHSFWSLCLVFKPGNVAGIPICLNNLCFSGPVKSRHVNFLDSLSVNHWNHIFYLLFSKSIYASTFLPLHWFGVVASRVHKSLIRRLIKTSAIRRNKWRESITTRLGEQWCSATIVAVLFDLGRLAFWVISLIVLSPPFLESTNDQVRV